MQPGCFVKKWDPLDEANPKHFAMEDPHRAVTMENCCEGMSVDIVSLGIENFEELAGLEKAKCLVKNFITDELQGDSMGLQHQLRTTPKRALEQCLQDLARTFPSPGNRWRQPQGFRSRRQGGNDQTLRILPRDPQTFARNDEGQNKAEEEIHQEEQVLEAPSLFRPEHL